MTGVGMVPAPFGGNGVKAMRYRVELLGRKLGAIGIQHWITCEVEADSPGQAEEKARDQHEVWMLRKVEELTNG